MTQAWHRAADGGLVRPAPGAAPVPATGAWLVLSDGEGPIDLPRLFPDVPIRIEPDSRSFALALSSAEPAFVVLVAPPAGPSDLEHVARWLLARPSARAVLLSPRNAVTTRLHALELGFADAIDLGGEPMEIVGRLSIAGHRMQAELPAAARIPIGDGLELDRRARAVWRDGRLEPLRPKEFELLEFLAAHPGRAFSRSELLRRVWNGRGGHERLVDVHVFWLRSRVEANPGAPTRIVTVRGAGYRFDPPPVAAGPVNVNEPPTRR